MTILMDSADFSLVCQDQCYEGVFLPVERPANQYDTIAELTGRTVINDLPSGREWSGMGVHSNGSWRTIFPFCKVTPS